MEKQNIFFESKTGLNDSQVIDSRKKYGANSIPERSEERRVGKEC